MPAFAELQRAWSDADAQSVLDRLVKNSEAADRRSSAVLTASAFVVALAGAPIATAADNPGMYVPSAVLGLFALLAALRAVTRTVEERPGLPPDWQQVEVAHDALAAKRAWGWVAARCLRVGVYWLIVLTVLLSVM